MLAGKDESSQEERNKEEQRLDALSEELKILPQFCVRTGKRPFIRSGKFKNSFTARWQDPTNTRLTFSEALEAVQRGQKVKNGDRWQPVDGIGFLVMRSSDDAKRPLGGDLDCCRDPETGDISPWAKEFLQTIRPFYTEASPSLCGLRFFAWGHLPSKRSSIFGSGPQDDLPIESRERIFAAKPNAREKADKGEPVFNCLEFYESNRHLTITGARVDEFCYPSEDRTEAIAKAVKPFLQQIDKNAAPLKTKATPSRKSRLPKLDILDVIDTSGFTESGGQLFGPHPVLGSTSGKNLVIDPSGGRWSYMHNKSGSSAPGGDAWVWLACECGAVPWERAGAGVLKDPEVIRRTLEHAVKRRLVSADILGPTKEPTIRPISLNDPIGAVGLDGDGCIKTVECDKDGQKTLKWLSDCALCIHTETVAKDVTEFNFKGVGAKDHRQIEFILPASALADPRKFKAALINAFGARNRAGRLDFEAVQRLTRNPRLLKRVEVPTWEDNMPLLPGVGLADNVEYRLSSKIPAAVYDGDLQAAKTILQKLLKTHKFAPILVAAIMGAPVVARWHKGDRFGLGLWGGTGSLKTSTALAALGIFGTGYIDGPKLKAGKGGSTTVGAMEVFSAAGFLPQIYDDVKTVDSKDSAAYVATVHAVLEGEEKARGKKDGGLRESREFLCTPIITGEIRPAEASTSARILNLNWSRSDDKLLGEVQQNAALLPVIGYHWLRFMAGTSFILGKDFDAFRSKKFSEFIERRYTNPGRLATIYTLLISIWDLLQVSPIGDVFIEARESFKEALREATAIHGQAVTDETEIERFLSGLEELLAGNPGLIMSEDGRKVIAGSVIGKRTDRGLFLLPTQTLNELVKIRAFNQQPSIDSITQGLNEMGLLIRGEKDKLKTRFRIGRDRVYGWHIVWSPVDEGLSPATGDGKNDNNKPFVPGVPGVPPEYEREKISEINSRSSEEKKLSNYTGDRGDKGDSSIVNRLVDSDFDGKESVPGSVPGDDHTGDMDGAGLTQNSTEKGATSEKSTHSAYKATAKTNDPGLQKFKAGMKKRQCCLCGRTFPYDLTPYVGDGKRGYICVTCHMTGPPPEPEKADSQTKLEDGQ